MKHIEREGVREKHRNNAKDLHGLERKRAIIDIYMQRSPGFITAERLHHEHA